MTLKWDRRIIPLRDLQHLYVTGIIFKRSSQKQLICPQLLQRFTALALPKHISKDRSPFSIISLFDGSGSFTDVIAKALGAWPNAILAAENDAGTRSGRLQSQGLAYRWYPLDT